MRVPQPSIGLDPSSSGNHQVSLEAYLEGEAGRGAVGKDTCRKAPESSRPHCKTEVSLPPPPPPHHFAGRAQAQPDEEIYSQPMATQQTPDFKLKSFAWPSPACSQPLLSGAHYEAPLYLCLPVCQTGETGCFDPRWLQASL